MAELIWTVPALNNLDAIADYIALDKPEAARQFVKRVFRHVGHLREHPESGSTPRELIGSRYRQVVEPPCRVFYRYDGQRGYILFVMRGEVPPYISVRRRKRRDNLPHVEHEEA